MLASPQDLVFEGRAERVVVDARILDGDGRPVTDLVAGDFEVRIDGEPAEVLGATWAFEGATPTERQQASERPDTVSAPTGRLVVLLFQKDMHASRTAGLMQQLRQAHEVVTALPERDRIAVLSFDSHLRLFADFDADRSRVLRALENDVLFSDADFDLRAATGVALTRTLEPRAARDASTPEAALRLIGEALEPLPGAKAVVFFGGTLGADGMIIERDYSRARQAMLRARASVFSLDVTDADAHSLEGGLKMVAKDTGGFFARTHQFPANALRRVAAAIEGHYVLEVDRPLGLERGRHEIDVGLTRRSGEVLARPAYYD